MNGVRGQAKAMSERERHRLEVAADCVVRVTKWLQGRLTGRATVLADH